MKFPDNKTYPTVTKNKLKYGKSKEIELYSQHLLSVISVMAELLFQFFSKKMQSINSEAILQPVERMVHILCRIYNMIENRIS